MSISRGYDQLQPKYILGTDAWVSAAAESLVGAEFNPPNQLREHLPFFPFAKSQSVVVPRVGALSTAAFLSNQLSGSDASVSTLVDPPEEIALTSIVGDVTINTFPVDVQSESIDQLQLEIEFKKIAIRIAFWNQFFRPRNGTTDMRGLPDLIAPAQIISAGGALTLDGLDLLVAQVTEGDSEMGSKVVVMNSQSFVAFVRARRALGLSLEYAVRDGRRYAVHNGATILVSDFVPNDRSLAAGGPGLTSIWCFTLGYEQKGVFGIYPPSVGEDGLVVEKVQGGAGADTLIYRARWYTAVVLGQLRGLACLDGIQG